MDTKEALKRYRWVQSCLTKRKTAPDLMHIICSAVDALEEKLSYEKTALDAANIRDGGPDGQI